MRLHLQLPVLFLLTFLIGETGYGQKNFEDQLKHYPVVQNGYWVLSNTTLQRESLVHYDTIIPVRFHTYGYFVFGLPRLCDTLWQAKLSNGRSDLYSITGLKINTKSFDSLRVDQHKNLRIWSAGTQGLVTKDLKYIEPRYDQVDVYELEELKSDVVQPNQVVVMRTGTSYGFYSADGTFLKPRFSSIEPDPRNSGLFIAGKYGKEGFIHPISGSVGVPRKGILTMDTVSRDQVYHHPSTTWMLVHVKDSAYEMNLYGETRPLKNYTIHVRLDVKKTQRFGLYAKSKEDPSKGYWLLEPKFVWIRHIEGPYYLVSRGGKNGKGLYNDRGKEIIPPKMRKIYWKKGFGYGWKDRRYFTVLKNGKLGTYVDIPGKGGQLFIPIEQDYIGAIGKNNQFAIRVRKDKKYGLYSFDGKQLFTTTYDYTDVSTIYSDTIPYGICMAYAEGEMIEKTFSSQYATKITDVSEKILISVFVDHSNRFSIFKNDGLWYMHHYDSLFTKEFDQVRYKIAPKYSWLKRRYRHQNIDSYNKKYYRIYPEQYLLKEDNKFVLIQTEKDSLRKPFAKGIFSMNVHCNRYWIYAYKSYHKTKRKKPLPEMRRVRRIRPWQQYRRKCKRT